MTVNQMNLNEPTIALLMGISFEKGVKVSEVYDKSVNIPKFIDYIEKLRGANGH